MPYMRIPALPAVVPAVKVGRRRMACSVCGTHVIVWDLMCGDGGQCSCCESYELVALPAAP